MTADRTPTRLVAEVTGAPAEPRVRHYVGMPPALTGGLDTRQQLGYPAIITIEEKQSGIFLYRFTLDGRCVGDTWHKTIDEAHEQVVFEFEGFASAWIALPADVTSGAAIVAFATRELREA